MGSSAACWESRFAYSAVQPGYCRLALGNLISRSPLLIHKNGTIISTHPSTHIRNIFECLSTSHEHKE